MNNNLELFEVEIKNSTTAANETNGYVEGLENAENSGNKDMEEYYRQKVLEQEIIAQINVEEKLNPENEEDEFGSCAEFCQKTETKSSMGSHLSY